MRKTYSLLLFLFCIINCNSQVKIFFKTENDDNGLRLLLNENTWLSSGDTIITSFFSSCVVYSSKKEVLSFVPPSLDSSHKYSIEVVVFNTNTKIRCYSAVFVDKHSNSLRLIGNRRKSICKRKGIIKITMERDSR